MIHRLILPPVTLLAVCSSLLLTGCVTSTPKGSARLALKWPPAEQIHWPAEYDPAKSAFFVHNQIDISAPPEVVWDIITDESFRGPLAVMQGTFLPNKLHGLHQEFLETLKIKAEVPAAS